MVVVGVKGENVMDAKKVVVIGLGIIGTGLGIAKIASDKTPAKFSTKWFETLSDADLNAEREIVRKAYCSSGDDFNLAVRLQNLLGMFDKELSKRAWSGRTDYGFPVHREHGWHLPSKD